MAERLDVDARDRPMASITAAGGWGRRILTILIALAALGGFAVVVVYSYDRGSESASEKTAPIINAQEGPTRIRPETPGGMAIPNQDKQIYNRLGGQPDPAKTEQLLPPPEPVATKPPPLPPPVPKAEMPPTPMPAAGETPVAPVETATADGPKIEAAPAAPKIAAPPKPAAPAATPRPASQMAKIVGDAANSGRPLDGWRIQLASLRSEAAGQQAWAGLRKKNGDLLGKLSMRMVKADIKGKGIYYRLQAGPLSGKDAASALCQKLKARKQGCIIVRP